MASALRPLPCDAQLLSAYRDDVLDEALRRIVETHVMGCPPCRQELLEYEQLAELVQSISVAPPRPRLASDVAARVVAAPRHRLRHRLPVELLAACALTVVIVAGLFFHALPVPTTAAFAAYPPPGASDVSTETAIRVTFPSPVDQRQFQESIRFDPPVTFDVVWDSAQEAELVPVMPLDPDATYALVYAAPATTTPANQPVPRRLTEFKTAPKSPEQGGPTPSVPRASLIARAQAASTRVSSAPTPTLSGTADTEHRQRPAPVAAATSQASKPAPTATAHRAADAAPPARAPESVTAAMTSALNTSTTRRAIPTPPAAVQATPESSPTTPTVVAPSPSAATPKTAGAAVTGTPAPTTAAAGTATPAASTPTTTAAGPGATTPVPAASVGAEQTAAVSATPPASATATSAVTPSTTSAAASAATPSTSPSPVGTSTSNAASLAGAAPRVMMAPPAASAVPTPRGCSVVPQRGFGLVYQGRPEVQDALGCATEPERAVAARSQIFQHGILVALPAQGLLYQFAGDASWQVVTLPAADAAPAGQPAPSATSSAAPSNGVGPTFQAYWLSHPAVRAALGLAIGPEQSASGAEQAFAHGQMLWTPGWIFVLEDGGRWRRFVDAWSPGAATPSAMGPTEDDATSPGSTFQPMGAPTATPAVARGTPEGRAAARRTGSMPGGTATPCPAPPALAGLWQRAQRAGMPLGCVAGSDRPVGLVIQPFERGTLLWRADTLQILALFPDGTSAVYSDGWRPGDPVGGTETPPPGFFAPVRGFGVLWRSTADLRDRLGWALTLEQGVAGVVLPTSQGIVLEAGQTAYALSGTGAWTTFLLPQQP